MASLKDIRNRIQSVKKTQKTTSAMKMVSAAKLKKSEDNVKSATPYAKKLRNVVAALSSRSNEDAALFQKPSVAKVAVIVVTSDRGLCGGYNANLCKKIMRHLDAEGVKDAEITTIGRKGRDFFKRTSFEMAQDHPDVPVQEQIQVVRSVIEHYTQRFEAGELGKVYLAHNHFENVLTQTPVVKQLFPIEAPEGEIQDDREIIFEPSPKEILGALLSKYTQNQVYVAWLDSIAGEHAARMTAMDAATKNAGDMIDQLQLTYNRTRQAAITKELIEIISGSESL